jgi:hypothetical protein
LIEHLSRSQRLSGRQKARQLGPFAYFQEISDSCIVSQVEPDEITSAR